MSLDQIYAQSREIKIGQTSIKIKQITVKHVPTIMGIVSKIMSLTPKIKKGDDQARIQAAIDYLASDFDSLKKVLEIGSDIAPDAIDDLNIAAATMILTEVIKENVSFFVQHVAPLLKNAVSETQTGLKQSKS